MSADEPKGPYIDSHLWTELARAESVPPNWVLPNVLLAGLTVLGGPPKAMKSTLTMAIACSLAGVDCRALPVWMRRTPRRGRVLILSAEASAGEIRYQVEQDMGVKLPDDGSILVAEDAWEWQLDGATNEAGLTVGQAKLLAQLEELQPICTIIDPYRDYTEADENDAAEVVKVLRPLRNWHHQHNSAFVLCHHTSKKPYDARQAAHTPEDLRGSIALLGKADGVLMLTPRGPKGDPNPVEINARFKRGKSWSRTVQVAAYGYKGIASEVLDRVDEKVLSFLSIGVPSVKSLAKKAEVPLSLLEDSLARLLRNGWILKHNGIPIINPKQQLPVKEVNNG